MNYLNQERRNERIKCQASDCQQLLPSSSFYLWDGKKLPFCKNCINKMINPDKIFSLTMFERVLDLVDVPFDKECFSLALGNINNGYLSFAHYLKFLRLRYNNNNTYTSNGNNSGRPMEQQIQELFDFQQEILNCNDNFIIFNGCRNASKTFMLTKIIEQNKPENVIIATDAPSLHAIYNNINKELYSVIQLSRCHKKIMLKTYDDKTINIYHSNYMDLNKEQKYDYIMFDNILPYNLGIKAEKSISTITYNNYDKWIQRFYPAATVFEVDYRKACELGLLKELYIKNTKKDHIERFYNDYAVLDNPKEDLYKSILESIEISYTDEKNIDSIKGLVRIVKGIPVYIQNSI